MSDYRNHVVVRGYLGGDAELKRTDAGHDYTRMSIATKKRWQNDASEWQERTEWHPIVVWGKLAERVATFKKGDLVEVIGELRKRSYDRTNGGVHVDTYDIVGDEVSNLPRRDRRAGADETHDADVSTEPVHEEQRA